VLTDLHVHLRPDGPGTSAQEHFTAANAERYRTVAGERGIAELGVSEHVYRFTEALEVWRHPLWVRSAVDDLDDYCAFVREETDLRLGIEADFVPGGEDRMAELLGARDWDYVVGSVHFLGDFAVDIDDETDVWRHETSPDRIWRRYFETLARAAATGMYDVIAHPDLVKVWGRGRPAPDRDPRFYYEPAVEAIAEAGAAMELSTAGLRKPAGELYPSRALLEMAVDAGIPIALSSDAHVPGDVGRDYDAAVAALEAAGVRELCVFERRQRRLEAIG
jgi:histidinol-phosphatase (PHP family)